MGATHVERSSALKRLVRQIESRLSENTVLLALAGMVGLATGCGVWLYRIGIEEAGHFFQETVNHTVLSPVVGALAVVITLALVGLIVGWIMGRFVGEERHHGVAGIMESVALSGGRLRYWKIPFKAVASVLSLGGGAAVGPEDPSVQIGSNIGSLFGQKLRMSDDRVRLLVAAGAASAVAAAFRAPIAGVFFAVEIILNGEFSTGSIGVVVLSSVISSVFVQALEGTAPELGQMAFQVGSPLEVPFFALLGILLAPVSAVFLKTVFWQHDLWHKYAAKLPRPVKTALAGALVGVIAIFLPQIMGTGRETMIHVLSPNGMADFGVLMLLALGAAKMLGAAISLAGGFVGGMFAPSLFVGITLGAAYGQILNQFLPAGAIGSPQAYAIAGMAAVMTGVIRSPITAILLVFELTNDYRLILPIMLATAASLFLVERFAPRGIYSEGLHRKGIKLERGRDVDVMQSIRVEDVMTTPPPRISASANLLELRDELRRQRARSLCVVDEPESDRLIGIVTLSDLQRAYETNASDAALTVGDICTHEVITVTGDESLATAIRRLGARDVGRLPVIAGNRDNTPIVIGIVSRHDILRAYNSAITQKTETQYHQEQARLYHLTGAHVITLRVAAAAPIAGRLVHEIDFPDECVIASIKRGERLIVPHGATTISAGDVLTFVASPEAESELHRLTSIKPADSSSSRARKWV